MADSSRIERVGPGGLVLALLFGVLAPAAAVVVEYSTGICAETFFDPLPTAVHAAAFLLIPIVVCWLHVTAQLGREPPRWLRGAVWGAATAVAAWYSLAFLPISPLSVIAILVMGMGLLSLSPLTSLIFLLRLRPARGEAPAWKWGALAALGLLCVADLPQATAHVLLTRAGSDDSETAAAALETLRDRLPDDAIVAAAGRPVSMMSPVGAAARLLWERDRWRTQVAAFRATGRLVQPPRSGPFFGEVPGDGEWTLQGGETVGTALVPGLCLSSSMIVGEVDAVAGVAQLRWDVTFRNDHEWTDSEARALVQLPEGSVVDGATLWVAGQPREAVFAERGKARAAYQDVVQVQRRDPLLVTASGPDRVLVQCFPILAGGTMRIALDIATPVRRGDGAPRVELPRLAERNFAICEGAVHTVSLHGVAGGPTQSAGPAAEQELDRGASIDVPAVAPVVAWAPDPYSPEQRVLASHEPRAAVVPAALTAVIDASTSTRPARDAVAALLSSIPDGTPTQILVASDRMVDATGGVAGMDDRLRAAVRTALADLPWRGGSDPAPALLRATASAATVPGGRVLWLHGSQELFPVEAPETTGAEPRIGSLLPTTTVFALRIGAGRNRAVEELRSSGVLSEPHASGGTAAERVATLLGRWFDERPVASLGLRRLGPDATLPPGAARARTSQPLAALWARGEVERLRARDRTAAARLGAAYRVVTPVTGAVVLETDADYARAGLTAPDAPAVPEPGEWAILMIIAGALFVAWRRRTRVAAA